MLVVIAASKNFQEFLRISEVAKSKWHQALFFIQHQGTMPMKEVVKASYP